MGLHTCVTTAPPPHPYSLVGSLTICWHHPCSAGWPARRAGGT